MYPPVLSFVPYGKPLLSFRSAPGWAVVSSSCGIRESSPALVGGTFLTGVGFRSYEYTGYVICSHRVVIVSIVVGGGRGRETNGTSRNLHTLSPCYCRFMLSCTRRSRYLQWSPRSDWLRLARPDVVEGLAAWFWLHIRVPLC